MHNGVTIPGKSLPLKGKPYGVWKTEGADIIRPRDGRPVPYGNQWDRALPSGTQGVSCLQPAKYAWTVGTAYSLRQNVGECKRFFGIFKLST